MEISGISWILVALYGTIVVALSIGIVAFIKVSVLFRHAAEPAHHDHGDDTLDQGRAVRPEKDGEWS